MILISRHKLPWENIADDETILKYKKSMENTLTRMFSSKKANLYYLAKNPELFLSNKILRETSKNLSSEILIIEEMLSAHFKRALSSEDVNFELYGRNYSMPPISNDTHTSFYDWCELYWWSLLSGDKSRKQSVVHLDIESINPENRSYWWVAFQFFKAYEKGHERNIFTYRERAEEYAKDGKTFFIGLEEKKNIKVANASRLKNIWYPVVELFYLVYFNKEEEFNAYLAHYLESKKNWIIKNKETDNSSFFIDYPSLAACAEAHRKGFNITVESDYIPAWVYRGEYA